MFIQSLNRFVGNVSGKLPLRTVLIVPFVVQIVGTVGLVGYFSFKSGQESVEDLAQQLMTQVGERVSDRLTTYLQAPQNAVAANYLAVEQGLLNINDFEQLRQQFWQQLTLNPSLEAVEFANESAEAIGYGRFQSEELVKQAEKLAGEDLSIYTPYFNILKSTDPGKRKYYLVDSKGNPRKHIYTFPIDNRTVPWYRAAKAAKQQIWSPIHRYKIVPMLGIDALAPIYDAAGKWRGAFVSRFLLSTISTFLGQLHFSPSGQIFIMERSGKLVATSTLETLLVKSAKGEPGQLLAVNSKDTRTRDIARQLTQKFGNFHTLQNTQKLSLVSNHERQFVRVTSYLDKYGLDWLVVVVVPESDFIEQIHANTRTTILLCIIALVGSVGVGIVTTRWITKPILHLNTAAKDIAKGQWDKPVEIERADEVGELAKSFNQMAAHLQQSFAELNSLNAALTESESKLNQILEAIPVGVSVHDISGKLIYANQTSRQLLGIEALPDAETGQLAEAYQVYQTGTEQLYPVENMPVARSLQGERARVDDMEIRLPDRTIPLEFYSTPLFDADEKIVAAIAAFFDITDRKQAQKILADYHRTLETEVAQKTEALHRSEALLNEAQHIAKIGNWSWNLVSDERWWSPQMYQIVGLNPQEYPVLPDIETVNQNIHPEDRERVNQITREAIKQGISYDIEFRFLRPDGSITYAFSRGLVERDSEGQVTRFWGISQDISDRKLAEIALRESEHKFSSIFHTSPDPAWIATLAEGRVLNTNDRMATFLGYSQAEMLGKTCVDLNLWANPEDLAYFRQQLTQNGNIQDFEVIFRLKSGELRTILLSAIVSHLDRQDCVIGLLKDISDRKIAEQALIESEARFHAFMNNSPLLAWISDGDGKLLYCNRSAELWNERAASELIGETIWALHPPDIAQQHIENIRYVINTRQVLKTNESAFCSDGTLHEFLSYKFPLINANGQCLVGGIAADITDLEKSEERLQLVLDASELGLWDWNIATGQTYFDPSWKKMLGYEVDEVENSYQSWVKLVHPEDFPRISEALTGYLEGRLPIYEVELRMLTKSGDWKWILGHGKVSERDASGKPVRMIGTQKDIHARKLAEEALRESKEQLQLALEGSGDGFWDWNIQTGEVYLSPRYIEMLGYEADELPQEFSTWDRLIHPDDKPWVMETLYQLAKRMLHIVEKPLWNKSRLCQEC